MYTQNSEEKYIVEALTGIQNGRFLDIGAHDGITFSSTRKLWDMGWSGVYVEPSPDVLKLLNKNKGENCEVLPVAIGTTNGKCTFYSTGEDMVGTLSQSHVDLWKNNVTFSETLVDVVTVEELKTRVGCEFDFVGIDVEGINKDVFDQFDWSVWKPTCVCIEYESYKDEITNTMTKAGYELMYTSSENLVFRKKLICVPIISHIANIIENTSKDRPFVFLEIGACDGFHSQLFASILRIYSQSFIMHSFEPVADLISAWKNWTIHHSEHIKLFNKAVGIVDGQIPFYISYGADYYGDRKSTRLNSSHRLTIC